MSEQPTLMTLVDSSLAGVAGSAADNTICVGYRGQFDLLNECTGELSHLFTVHDSTKSHLVAAIDLYEDEEPELLLCYNSKGIYGFSFREPIHLFIQELTLYICFALKIISQMIRVKR